MRPTLSTASWYCLWMDCRKQVICISKCHTLPLWEKTALHLQMVATVNPADAAISSVRWKVSSSSIASISPNGVLHPLKSGIITVTAIANDGTEIQGDVRITITNATNIGRSSERPTPGSPILNQNYPNPFNPSTSISFNIPTSTYVTLKIYDLQGKEVTDILSGKLQAGSYTAVWDSNGCSSGAYFCCLHAGEYISTKKLVLMK